VNEILRALNAQAKDLFLQGEIKLRFYPKNLKLVDITHRTTGGLHG